MSQPSSRFTRRTFLKTSATGVVAASFFVCLSGRCTAAEVSPNDKINTAHIGVGGMGGADLRSISAHPQVNVFALCDVDSTRLGEAGEKHPNASRFTDFRQMLEKLGDKIDAVIVSTPDHTHAPAAMTALQLGKPVYCQKPLTHEVYEARRLREVATEKGLVTQMGIQVHASNQYRTATDIIQAGAIGPVSEVHAWSNKNWGYDGGPFTETDPVPETLNWNAWLGTAAERPFKAKVYHPGQWRKLIDFGTGTLGDMGVHIFDTPYRALELTAPNWSRTTCRPPTGLGHPEQNMVEYEFPGTKHTARTLRWVWYDGMLAPPKELQTGLPADFQLPGQGALFVGEKGTCLLPHVGMPQLFPEKDFADYKFPELPPLNHYAQFVDACLGKTKTSAHFGYAGQLTEALLLGVVGNRFPGETLKWDAAGMRVINLPEANKLLRRDYRHGFEVEGLSDT